MALLRNATARVRRRRTFYVAQNETFDEGASSTDSDVPTILFWSSATRSRGSWTCRLSAHPGALAHLICARRRTVGSAEEALVEMGLESATGMRVVRHSAMGCSAASKRPVPVRLVARLLGDMGHASYSQRSCATCSGA